MKRKLSLLLAVLLLAALLPTTALAATRNYLEVSITETNAPQSTVSGTSGLLSLSSDSLTAAVVQVVNSVYDGGEGALKVFGSGAMKRIVNDGLAAYNAGSWNTWVEQYRQTSEIVNANAAGSQLDIKAKLADLDTKVGALTADVAYQLSYTPENINASDPAHGNTYIVTVTLRSSETLPEEGGKKQEVKVAAGKNGSASASDDTAVAGQVVRVTLTPDKGYDAARLIVTDANANRVEVRYEGNNVYSFVMPASGVTAQPIFRRQIADPAETGVSEQLNTEEHVAFMVGDKTGTFRPSDSVTRAEVAQMFYRLLKDTQTETAKTFSDVKENAWYAQAVQTLAGLGIVKGVGEDRFEPQRAITRAEFTAIAARFAKAASGSVRFSDVPETHWAYSAIATAAEYGWIVGSGDGTFSPNANITRAEAAAIVNRMLGRLSDFDAIDAGEGRRFSDVRTSFWGFYDITEASTEHGFTFDEEHLHELWK